MRDFLWAVIVLGLVLGWALDQIDSRRRSDEAQANLLKAQLEIKTLEAKVRLERELAALKEQLKAHQDVRRTIRRGLQTQAMVDRERVDE